MALNKLTIDFETFYSREYSLSKMTTEEYIRDKRFEVIGVSVKVNNGYALWASGTHDEIAEFLAGFDWANSILIGQNTAFDGAILNWHFGLTAKLYADIMCMSRAVDGVHVSASLDSQAKRHLPEDRRKGHEVMNAMGKRRLEFTEQELSKYGDYCINDVELTYDLFMLYLRGGFPLEELKVIDTTLRMFIVPTMELDIDRLQQHLFGVEQMKEKILADVGVDRKVLGSNDQFADKLREYGVEPPTKISPRTGKVAYAFAKTDAGMKALLEHDNPEIQILATARLGTKSTLEESRTNRFIGIAQRGTLPAPIKYYGAHTGRWSGFDKINLQNLPSRGQYAKRLKKTIRALEGFMLIEGDLSQIEARLVAWLAGQQDLVDAFARGDDVYIAMASKIYGVPPSQVTPAQRFIGKMTILGCGYGMGAEKFADQLFAQANVRIPLDESRLIVHTYRKTNFKVKQLWSDANRSLAYMCRGQSLPFGKQGVIDVDAGRKAIILPNTLPMFYHGLHVESQNEYGDQYAIRTRKGVEKIYGGKSVENVCQALAKLVIAEQMMQIRKKYHVAMTVHDSVIVAAPENHIEEAGYDVYKALRFVPSWAEGLPLDCELGFHKYYGQCGDNAEDFTRQCAEQYKRDWPEESRIDIIGRNGNTGEHYARTN